MHVEVWMEYGCDEHGVRMMRRVSSSTKPLSCQDDVTNLTERIGSRDVNTMKGKHNDRKLHISMVIQFI